MSHWKAPEKTAAQKAAEILGHQAGCANSQRDPETHGCVCAFPLPILVAAIKGTLRREHEWTTVPTLAWTKVDVCRYCQEEREDADNGPCHPPLDGALAAEILEEAGKLRVEGKQLHLLADEDGWLAVFGPDIEEEWPTLKEVAGRFLVRLHDEGLL